MVEIELREDGAGRRYAVFDQVSAQEAHRHGVDEQGTLFREADHAAFGVQLK